MHLFVYVLPFDSVVVPGLCLSRLDSINVFNALIYEFVLHMWVDMPDSKGDLLRYVHFVKSPEETPVIHLHVPV